MGALCSSHKNGDELDDGDDLIVNPAGNETLPSQDVKMDLGIGYRTEEGWRGVLDGALGDVKEYERAREKLLAQEKLRGFDARMVKDSSAIENEAVAIVQKLKIRDWERIYSPANRAMGQHFLGSVDLINKTDVMKVARRLPKGAHLHIHFNSCLPATFLIRQARNIDAMYIRSTVPLTTAENWAAAQVSFMVMTLNDATHPKDADGVPRYVPLGDCFHPTYSPNVWMEYKRFQRDFVFTDSMSKKKWEGTEGAERWLEMKLQISENEAHGTLQTGKGVWEKFNYRTQMMKGLFTYESAFRAYTRACIEDFVQDGVHYAEVRPNFMITNSLRTDDGTRTMGNEEICRVIDEELRFTMADMEQKGKFFGGMKVIYCTPRIFCKEKVKGALDECIKLKQKYSNLICGFDLLGHEEMGNELKHFVPELLSFRKKCNDLKIDIPFLFHCGETLQNGDKVDGNLFDAILLKAKRIGHGYALARHPMLMDIFKEKNIAVESCPISNEILGLTPVMAGHNLPILLANNVPCTINSDNATFYRSSLSHDFYQVMIGSEAMTILGWKQLAKWSLEHSCMDDEQRRKVTAHWDKEWKMFCEWIVECYGAEMEIYNPSEATVKALRLDPS